MLREDRQKELLAKKTDFVIKNYTGGIPEVTRLFGYKKSSSITNICKFDTRNPKASRSIVQLQMEGLQRHYQIPPEIFKDSVLYDEESIKNIIEEYRLKLVSKKKSQSLFLPNEKLMQRLKGDWYSYFLPSTDLIEVQCIKTTVNSDYTVVDEYNNRGIIHIGADQSLIVKESNNSKNITTVTFNNIAITYDIFPYAMCSRTNITNRPINFFGFFSRKKLDTKMAKKILGEDRTLMQLQIPYEFEERVAKYIVLNN